jgi:hypothetical protein
MDKTTRNSRWLDAFGLFIAGLNNTFLALLVAVLIHGPGTTSTQPDILLRATYIAEHITSWKAGWFFWFAPTLSFSWSYFALGRHLSPKVQWRDLAIGVALIAAAVDIVGVLMNAMVLPELAIPLAANTMPDQTLQVIFVSLEKFANSLTNIGGFGLYSLAGILLLPAVFMTPGFPRWLKWIGIIEWGVSILATGLLVLAPSFATFPLVISFMFYAPWVWGSAWWILKNTNPIEPQAT